MSAEVSLRCDACGNNVRSMELVGDTCCITTEPTALIVVGVAIQVQDPVKGNGYKSVDIAMRVGFEYPREPIPHPVICQSCRAAAVAALNSAVRKSPSLLMGNGAQYAVENKLAALSASEDNAIADEAMAYALKSIRMSKEDYDDADPYADEDVTGSPDGFVVGPELQQIPDDGSADSATAYGETVRSAKDKLGKDASVKPDGLGDGQ